ncbi:MATH domain and coiled-coil domain-containing protein [Drosera capensis]
MAQPNNSALYGFSLHDASDVIRSVREAIPAHYLIEIESFWEIQDLRGGTIPKYFESTKFNAADHKWVLVIYPHGNKDEDGKDYISLYLKLVSKLDHRWPVEAIIKFFIYDYKLKKYLTIQGPGEHTYDAMEKERGIAHAIPFSEFTRQSNGFLKNDRCKFGVEVFVTNTIPKTVSLSILNKRKTVTFTWRIKQLSEVTEGQSSEFIMEGRLWELIIHPRGFGGAQGKSLSLFLNLVDCSDLIKGIKLFVGKTLRVKNQLNEDDVSVSTCGWYTNAKPCKGISHLLSVSDLHNANKGFKVEDQVIVEVELNLIMLMNDIRC